MANVKNSKGRRVMRHIRVRRKVEGTSDRPRLAIYRSLNHIYAQIIDDSQGNTVTSASSLEDDVRKQKDGKDKSDVASAVGELVSQRAKDQGIKSVVFDRGGHKYHGRIKALAEAARKGGLVF